jgi:peptidoglycan/xylan/chitin deacetylase (PgdA/CDA1 family)/tetratricopeptide (TPR) repeat protein
MNKRLLKYVLCAISMALCAVSTARADTVEKAIDEIVTPYRKIIVLFADEDQLSEKEQEHAYIVGKILYHEKLDRLQEFQMYLESDIDATQPPESGSFTTEDFLEKLEDDPDLWDADKLVFRALLESISVLLEDEKYQSERHLRLRQQLKEDLEALDDIQEHYDEEIGDIFSRFDTRALEPRRESWDQYVEFLKSRFDRPTILSEYDPQGVLVPEYRGEEKQSEKHETFGRKLPKKTIVFTFDDGPHPRYTERILNTLNKYEVKAVFFQIGKQVGRFKKDGNITLTKAANVNKKILESGSVLANHSYTHSVLPKLSKDDVSEELKKTNTLLRHVAGKDPVLFRAPYGARNNQVLAQIKAQNLRSVMWNIDSKDWADPVPKSVARRVLKIADKEQRGIILFHDIQPQTTEALPLVLDALKKRGYRFASWNGQEFTLKKDVAAQKTASSSLYRESWAVLIGIDDYAHWPKLRYAVNDAMGMKDLLINKFGFKAENVFTLFNEEATRKNILKLFHDKLADPKLMEENDRVFVFYAGHGATRKLPSGRDLGYVIPVDADARQYYGEAISMTNISDIAEAMPAKHMLFVMDSCYSGLALVRGGGTVDSQNYIQETSQRTARQMLTAGGTDQQVADGGPNGHSIFTWTLLQSLQGEGDLNKDSYITASELAAHIGPVVSSISLQTPAFGNLLGSEGGDFIFVLERQPEFLSELSEQLDDQALRLHAQIEKMRDKIQQKRERNLKLKEELSAVKKQIEEFDDTSGLAAGEQKLTPAQLNNQGLQLYQEKKYEEALGKFLASATSDPTYIEAVNNAGYVYYKVGQYENAIFWLKKAIALDPERSVAWLNLGDAYFKLEHYTEARDAYQEHLRLSPNSRAADSVKEKIKTIEAMEE